MSSTLKIIFRKIKKDEPLGYVSLQRIENRKNTVRSLKLPPFDIKHWNRNSQRVRKTTKLDWVGYNETIEKALSDVLGEGKSFDSYDGVNSKLSYLHFYKEELNKVGLTHGTRLKYGTVYKKLTSFLLSKGKPDLLFSELSRDFLEEFRHYMKHGGMETNTAIHYLKILKVIFGKAEQNQDLIIRNNPFHAFDFGRKKSKTKETLHKDEIFKLIDTQIDNPRLSRAKDLFLFQFFTGGMRVSDLVTLRYNNLKNGRISYAMFKTNVDVDIAISDHVLNLIKRLLGIQADMNDPVEVITDISQLKQERLKSLEKKWYGTSPSKPYGFPDKVLESVPLSAFIKKSYWLYSSQFIHSMTMEQLTTEHDSLTKFIESKGVTSHYPPVEFDFSYLYNGNEVFYQSVLAGIANRIELLKKTHFDSTAGVLHERATDKETSTKFVFGMLKDSDFTNIGKKNDFSIASEEQYKKINRAGIVYNRNLKYLPKHTGIEKTFSTHLPRTSFANIMVHTEGVNSMDVSKALGHSSISITAEYLKTGFRDGRTDLVLGGLGKMFDR
jgi:site-specific recombinase XerD